MLTREDVPFLTADQMREVDRVMVDEYGILLIQMMENAGRALARFARDRFLVGTPGDPRVIVLAGTGGNGGGGLVAARRLHGWGVRVSVLFTKSPEEYRGVPGHQLDIVRRLGISAATADSTTSVPDAELIVDAIVGYPHADLNDLPGRLVATLDWPECSRCMSKCVTWVAMMRMPVAGRISIRSVGALT